MSFEPDYRNIVDVANNKRPKRLPVYEHIIDPKIMEKIFAELLAGNKTDLKQFFTQFCRFFKEMTYDAVSFEACIVEILPAKCAAIRGQVPGPIQNRADFQACQWGDIVEQYKKMADRQFEMLAKCIPDGMKAIGGVGNGVFEISEDLVGLEYLAYMQADDPQLFADLYCKIGDLMVEIWSWFLKKHANCFAVCRFGDDLGYKSGTLVSPKTIRTHIIPQYRRVIKLIHDAGFPFLMHSCGNIFDVMDDIIDAGINAKHSNEDVIAPFDKWVKLYGNRIGFFGGIDVDLLCRSNSNDVYNYVLELGQRFRNTAKGYALGSGNSIPDYVPVEGYLAMIRAAKEIRRREQA